MTQNIQYKHRGHSNEPHGIHHGLALPDGRRCIQRAVHRYKHPRFRPVRSAVGSADRRAFQQPRLGLVRGGNRGRAVRVRH